MAHGVLFEFYGYLVDTATVSAVSIPKYLLHVRAYLREFSVELPPDSQNMKTLGERHRQCPRKQHFMEPMSAAMVRFVLGNPMVREAVKMAVLLMWYLTVRGSDVCCQRQTYDPQYTLLISDIEESPCGSFYMVTIPRLKSDPLNLGGVGFVVATGGPMCPVSAIRVYLQSLRSAGFSASAPFLTCANGHFVVMSDIASAIKASAVALGQDPSLYSTQSVRAGSTNAMCTANVAMQDIMLHGKWSSTVCLRYFRHSLARINRVSAALDLALVDGRASGYLRDMVSSSRLGRQHRRDLV